MFSILQIMVAIGNFWVTLVMIAGTILTNPMKETAVSTVKVDSGQELIVR